MKSEKVLNGSDLKPSISGSDFLRVNNKLDLSRSNNSNTINLGIFSTLTKFILHGRIEPMINKNSSLSNNRIKKFTLSNLKFPWISVSIFAINISLMFFVSFYWLDQSFHTFFSGKPFN